MQYEERLARLEEKIDDLRDMFSKIGETLAAQAATRQLYIDKLHALEEDVVELKKEVTTVKGIWKLVAGGAALAYYIVGIIKGHT